MVMRILLEKYGVSRIPTEIHFSFLTFKGMILMPVSTLKLLNTIINALFMIINVNLLTSF